MLNRLHLYRALAFVFLLVCGGKLYGQCPAPGGQHIPSGGTYYWEAKNYSASTEWTPSWDPSTHYTNESCTQTRTHPFTQYYEVWGACSVCGLVKALKFGAGTINDKDTESQTIYGTKTYQSTTTVALTTTYVTTAGTTTYQTSTAGTTTYRSTTTAGTTTYQTTTLGTTTYQSTTTYFSSTTTTVPITGYKVRGTDLNEIFYGRKDSVTAAATNHKMPDGRDINQVFEKRIPLGPKAPNTGYAVAGQDLSLIFEPINQFVTIVPDSATAPSGTSIEFTADGGVTYVWEIISP